MRAILMRNRRSGIKLATMSDDSKPDEPLSEVGRYPRLSQARLRGLVVSAGRWPHWIKREGDEWILFVEPAAHEAVARELAAFEIEEKERPRAAENEKAENAPMLSLFVAAAILSAFFFAQGLVGQNVVERGVADSRAILHGEWWRAITALTLHGDPPHLIANLATGLLFAAFLLPRLGAGLTWFAIILSGALGNAINAWGYRGESHHSIGASTACFGALGILVGAELAARWSDTHRRNRWQLVLPLGAGLGLLAYLGVGDEGKNIDYMAHCWGFIAGCGIGAVAAALRLKERASTAIQRVAAALALGVLALAWILAIR